MSLQPLSPPLASPSPVPSMTNSISSYDPLAQTLPIVLGYVSVFCFTLQLRSRARAVAILVVVSYTRRHDCGVCGTCDAHGRYVPQLWLNYSRKSVKGFSTTGIIIKFIGSSFHFFTALVQHEKVCVCVCESAFSCCNWCAAHDCPLLYDEKRGSIS